MRQSLLPETIREDELTEFVHQVGGRSHKNVFCRCLYKYGDLLLKPLQSDMRGDREALFYQTTLATNSPLLLYIPRFEGLVRVADREDDRLLVIQDVTCSYRNPCIADIKIGKQTWDRYAAPEKQARERQKYPEQSKFGFRFVGMKVFLSTDYVQYNKGFGRTIRTDSEVVRALQSFLPAQTAFRTEILEQFIIRINAIAELESTQTEFEFYSTSLIIVYEANSLSAVEAKSKANVYMIDFAHTYPFQHKDNNYSYGINRFKSFLEDVLK